MLDVDWVIEPQDWTYCACVGFAKFDLAEDQTTALLAFLSIA